MINYDKELASQKIAKNVAELFNSKEDTTLINLGIGIPTMVSNYITNENVFIHAENGMLGVGEIAHGENINPDIINAGRQYVCETKGCCYFDSTESFGMIRGGHVDATVLGAFEVDSKANVSNWIIPNGKQLGVGGAMDLVSGSKEVIIAMRHTDKNGKSKLVSECKLPITGNGEVDLVVTEYAVFKFEGENLVLKAKSVDITVEELQDVTDINFTIDQNLKDMLE